MHSQNFLGKYCTRFAASLPLKDEFKSLKKGFLLETADLSAFTASAIKPKKATSQIEASVQDAEAIE